VVARPTVWGGAEGAHELFGVGQRPAGEKIWARWRSTLFIPRGSRRMEGGGSVHGDAVWRREGGPGKNTLKMEGPATPARARWRTCTVRTEDLEEGATDGWGPATVLVAGSNPSKKMFKQF
jgi:hypothetical protein